MEKAPSYAQGWDRGRLGSVTLTGWWRSRCSGLGSGVCRRSAGHVVRPGSGSALAGRAGAR